MRILNFCHLQFEETNRAYAASLQSKYNKSLRSLLKQGLEKPVPIRSTMPTLEFRFNKVIGKYEAIRLLKKRKKAPADYQGDFREQVFQLEEDIQTESIKKKVNVYKRSRTSLPSQIVEEKILIDFKKTSGKYHGLSSAPSKKSNYAIHHLETDETDETEEQDLRKESPFKNAVFEEDKEDYKYKHGYLSPFKKDLKDQGVQTTDIKLSPAKVDNDDTQQKSTPSMRPRKLLNILTNQKEAEKEFENPIEIPTSPPKELSFGDGYNNQSFGNPQDSPNRQEESNVNILPQENKPTEPQEQYNNTAQTNESVIKESLFDLPKTPTFTQGKLFQFNNNNNNKEVTNTTEKSETIFTQQPVNVQAVNPFKEANEKKEDKGNISFENVSEEAKPTVTVTQVEEKPKAPLPIFDFLKPYQSTSSTSAVENNPFLSNTVNQEKVTLSIDKIIGQSSSKEELDNPFLNPAKTDVTPFLFARNNSSTNSTNENSNPLKSISSTPNNLFSNPSSSQNSNGLWNLSPSNNQNANSEMGNKITNPASSLFGGDISNQMNNTPMSSIFQNHGNEMEREASMGMHNNLFNQQTNNINNNTSFGLFQNTEQKSSIFGNFNNNNFSQNTFNSPSNNQLGGLGGSNGNGMGTLFSNTSATNSLFGNNNNNINSNNNQGSSNFSMLGNNFNNQNTASNNLFGNSFTGNNQTQNNLFNSVTQSNTSGSDNLFSGGGNPFLQNNSGNNGNSMGMGYRANTEAANKDAANFLGLGSGNNSSQQTTQGRVIRKIIHPFGNKNKDRAF